MCGGRQCRHRNRRPQAKITSRIDRLSRGHPGHVRPVEEGVSELKVDTGSGYRICYKQTGKTIVVILCGGDKSSQQKDIEKTRQIAARF
jgi:putative addiction module killer protein